MSVNIKNNAEKDVTFLFLLKSGSFQIKPWVAFRLPYWLIELFFIGVPVVPNSQADVWSYDYQNLSDT